MFYKRLCDQWECEADDAIAELERQQGRAFSEKEKAVFRKRGEHRFQIPDGSRWGDVKAASTNIGEVLTKAMRAVANANDELRGVFTVDWNQPAPDGSGKPLIPNEVVHALVQHFDEHDLSNRSVPPDVLGRAYEYLIKQFADDAGAKAGEFFTPPEVVDTLVRILEPRPGDTVYDPTAGSGGMLVHAADYLREQGHHATSARYFAQEMNWGNAAIGKINSVLHGLEADIKAGASTITDPQFLEDGRVKKFSLVLANFPFSDEFWWLKPEQQTDDKKKKDKLKKEIFGKEGFKDPFGRFGRGTGFKAPPAGYGDYAFILHILASLTDDGRAGIVCPQGVLFRGQPEVEEETGEFDDDGNPKMKRRKADDEHLIRKALLDSRLIDAVISLPLNVFYGAGVPACLLILRKQRPAERRDQVLLIYAARHYRELSAQNELRPQDVMRMLVHYHAYGDAAKVPGLVAEHSRAHPQADRCARGGGDRAHRGGVSAAGRQAGGAGRRAGRGTHAQGSGEDEAGEGEGCRRHRQSWRSSARSSPPSSPSATSASPRPAAAPRTTARTWPRWARSSSPSTPIPTSCSSTPASSASTRSRRTSSTSTSRATWTRSSPSRGWR